VAYLSLNGELVRLEGSFPVLVLDAQGHSVPGVVVEPAEVRLELEVEQGEQGDGPVVKEGTSE
jgi:YbbR domain-containing protein